MWGLMSSYLRLVWCAFSRLEVVTCAACTDCLVNGKDLDSSAILEYSFDFDV